MGENVFHLAYKEWGNGKVEEVMTSMVPGGTCLVRIRFQDGQLRVFNNDLESEGCCYYFGIRRRQRYRGFILNALDLDPPMYKRSPPPD